jgi:hypothetical protein
MSGKVIPLIGKRFGQLVVLDRIGTDKNHRHTWLCRCDCGEEIVGNRQALMGGDLKTCNNINNKYHIEKRLNDKTIKFDNGCWNWIGSKNGPNGYGLMCINGNNQVVHRIRYELVFGKIPSNLYVLHTCDNRLCNNPNHLLLGTYQDNVIDMYNKKRNYNMSGEGNGRSKLTFDQVTDIRKNYSVGRAKEFSDKYNVSKSTIFRIVSNKGWKSAEVI